MTMLSDDAAVEAVTFGADGILATLPGGAVHVSSSTISVALAKRLTAAHAEAGQSFVTAPVFGRPEAAAAAKLFVVAAGAPDAVQSAAPLFDAIGQRTFVVAEEPTAASMIKLSGNFLIASVIESLGEAMALVGKMGVDKQQYLEILTSTLFGAPVYKTYGGLIARGEFEPAGFAAPLGFKDVRLVLAAGEEMKVPLPVASLLRDRFLTLLAGGGEQSRLVGGRGAGGVGGGRREPLRLTDHAAQAVGAEHRLQHRRVVGSAAQHLTAVDVDDLSGDPARRVTEQEHRGTGDVGDLADPRQRRVDPVVLAELWRIEHQRNEFGADQAGADRVDPHRGGPELVGGQPHQVIDRGLADAIRAEPPVRVARRDGRDADERPSAAAHHLPGAVLEHVHAAVDVEVDGPPPRLRVDLGDRADRLRSARAVHDAIQPSVPRRRGLHHAADLVLVGDVGGLVDHRPSARRLRSS